MSTTNGEKDSLLGQTVLPTEMGQILGGLVFFYTPFSSNFSEAEFNPMRDRYGDFNTIELKMTSNVTSGNFSF